MNIVRMITHVSRFAPVLYHHLKTSAMPKSNGPAFYAVRKGRKPGIYATWAECHAQVDKFGGPVFKKFSSYFDAQCFMEDRRCVIVNTDGKIGATKSKSPEKQTSSSATSESSPTSPIETLQDQMGEMQEELRVLRTEASLLAQRVDRLDSTVFTAPQSKRALHTSSKVENPRLGKKAKLDAGDKVAFTGSSFSESQCCHVYTDGGCFDNGRNGARAGIGVYWGPDDPSNVSERLEGRPTNNRAEIHAAVRAVQVAKERNISNLVLHTDSMFLINSITKWIKGWKRNGWVLTSGKPVINREDFEVLDQALQGINVKWVHVKGHSGNPGNEAVDRLARQGASQSL